MSYEIVDEKLRALIAAIESSVKFDPDGLGEASGLGDEASMLYRNYVAGKALVTRASINYFRIGLIDTYITVYADYPLMRPLSEAFEALLSMPFSYMIAYGSPLGLNLFISRHIIPSAHYKDYISVFEELEQKGIIRGYEVMKSAWPRDVYSLDPSVFDFTTGNWKRGTYSGKIQRKVKKGDTVAVPFDEVDLKIVTMLKKSAATLPSAMAAATGLGVDEVLVHLKQHVLGGGDPAKSMILKYYVDFLEPGLFAPDTAVFTVFGESDDNADQLVDELAAIPYTSAIWQNEKVSANMYIPLQGLYAIAHEIGTIGAKLKLKDLTAYVSPWYYWNVFGSLHSPASLERNFRNGKWVFKKDDTAEVIISKVKEFAGK